MPPPYVADPTPRVTSHPLHATVHSRLLLVTGTCGTSSGNLWVSSHHCNFPPQVYPVRSGGFKALLHLSPGENVLELNFNDTVSKTHYPTVFIVTYIPLLQNPPLHLCIILASDSAERYDDVPNAPEPNNLETAKKKLRMAGYMWQAYTEAQMTSYGLGHRTFRLNEAWEPDTLSRVDSPTRSTAHITVIRSEYTMEHIRDPTRAQQNHDKDAGDLFQIAMRAIKPLFPGPENYIAALFLDATGKSGKILGHAALGGGTSQHHLAIFGSHSLFAWPSCLENVVPAFTDPRPVNTRHCAIDCEGSTYWMAANVGIGAMMHEVGHALGCPHQKSGVMMRDYVRLNRSFSAVEPSKEDLRIAPECSWHRLDALRFRCHPCFTLPSDANIKGPINMLGIDGGALVTATSGILFITFGIKGEEFPKIWLEWPEKAPGTYLITPKYLMENVDKDFTKITVSLWSLTGAQHTFSDIAPMLVPTLDRELGTIYHTPKYGYQSAPKKTDVMFPPHVNKLKIYCGLALDGIEFLGPGGMSSMFGNRGGSPHEFLLAKDEYIIGLALRYGAWVDAVQILLNNGRRSQWYGGSGGGFGEVWVPQGYRVCGMFGETDRWVYGIGLSYCKIFG